MTERSVASIAVAGTIVLIASGGVGFAVAASAVQEKGVTIHLVGAAIALLGSIGMLFLAGHTCVRLVVWTRRWTDSGVSQSAPSIAHGTGVVIATPGNLRSKTENMTNSAPDDAVARVWKLIPGESMLFYSVWCAMLRNGEQPAFVLSGFVLSAAIGVLALRRSAQQAHLVPSAGQYWIRLATFASWAAAVRNPVSHWVSFEPSLPAVLAFSLPTLGVFIVGAENRI